MGNIYKGVMFKMDLSLFAGEKTEKATPKRKRDARLEGQVAKSQELGTAALFLAMFTALRYFAPYMFDGLRNLFYHNFLMMENIDDMFTINTISSYMNYCFLRIVLLAAPLLIVALVVGLIVNIVQVGWHPSGKPLRPKLSKLNPIKGFKRVFGMQAIVNFAKSIAKLAIVAAVVYGSLVSEFSKLPQLMQLDLYGAVAYVADLCVSVGMNVGMYYIFIAAADYGYTFWKHTKDMRMSKQEIKDEYKMSEGDPFIKGKIRQRMRESSMRRMMHEVPQADVIITNPTHFAVALRYEQDKGEAPVVVAKGADFVAQRIKDLGTENSVPLVENKPLARALFQVEIGREIPPQLYQAVAEVLAYVYRLKHPAV